MASSMPHSGATWTDKKHAAVWTGLRRSGLAPSVIGRIPRIICSLRLCHCYTGIMQALAVRWDAAL